MKTDRSYLRFTWFLLIMVFAVIIAGGVVRMTQSGMGCPDWPRCFGRWIPPTDASQLPADYEKYLSKQDIDHTFNPYHTWIEYINRLLGALLGLFIIAHFIWTYKKFRKTDRTIVILSFLLLLLVGFQGWLGKRVVDHNLAAIKITTHMLVALVIAAIPLLIIYRLHSAGRVNSSILRSISLLMLLILLVQIILGTQVREQIDEISKSLSYSQRELWVGRLDKFFIFHRSLSWLIAAVGLWIWWKARLFDSLRSLSLFILFLVVATIVVGITMMWWAIPGWAQPLHLLLASILIISVFALWLRLK